LANFFGLWFGERWSHPFSPNSEMALVVGALPQWYFQHALMGAGSGFSEELYSDELYGECGQHCGCLNTLTWRGPQPEFRSNPSSLG